MRMMTPFAFMGMATLRSWEMPMLSYIKKDCVDSKVNIATFLYLLGFLFFYFLSSKIHDCFGWQGLAMVGR